MFFWRKSEAAFQVCFEKINYDYFSEKKKKKKNLFRNLP